MKIIDHRLAGAEFKPLVDSPFAAAPRYIVLHNTAGGSVQGSYDYLKSVGYSYHVLVARNGKPLQCVRFDRAASHAGKSNWRGRDSLNGFAFGISAANYGQLSPQADGKFYNRGKNGKIVTGIFTAEQVVVARHRNGGGKFGWEKYPNAQIDTMLDICRALIAEYPGIVDIIGHDDIAVGRKVDPGPAFPMEKFHALVPGRTKDVGPRMSVNTPGDTLGLRAAPLAEAPKIGDLAHGRSLFLRSEAYTYITPKTAVKNGWASVDLDGDLDHDGFVNTRYLQ
ncbi:N-acetylmuramoyl-L-alanine amidase [Longimicrobium sp.]|jgi:N-acetylmuramoyl-L-alanine amidase|uniref:N-acetylmuramoyl-L-alanine amidase n=1 Tax=Longimicrobium sp. TaxID=2029185 RepID=UPI002EDA47BB